MLFSSPEFIFFFLPAVLVGYLLLVRLGGRGASGAFLAVASLFFYAWWKPVYLPLILASIAVNYAITRWFLIDPVLGPRERKLWLVVGMVFNLGLLGYFKYAWFLVETAAWMVGSGFRVEPLLLPLAISFFTFQQIAFLVDAWKGEIRDVRFFDYVLFVSFFPQLIAGPIVHHREMMPQFADERRARWPGWVNMEQGVRIFLIGLAKKLILADTLAVHANAGWGSADELQFWAAWGTTLCYTFQLYFDFSGYSDMALGAARFFGIHLPINFNSPYKAGNIQDFWGRWHMTLSRWLKEYLYIPLGGNRRGSLLTYRNLFLTFVLGGIWHGAGWTFVMWGVLHGVGCIVHRLWSRLGHRMPLVAGWLITFIYVHIGWVFFRAPDLESALGMIANLFGANGFEGWVRWERLREYFLEWGWLVQLKPEEAPLVPLGVLAWLILSFGVALGFPNGVESCLMRPMRRPLVTAVAFALLAFACVMVSIAAPESPFLYFNF
jgi:alginate O-acetyltransferase complex protein AlgI